MEIQATLVALEEQGWQSLVEGTGRAWYRSRLAEGFVLVGPGFGLVEGEAALDRLSGATWSWFRIRSPRIVALSPDAAVLTYRVIARRDFDIEYQAVVASTYVEVDGAWRLAIHQHTVV